MEERMFFFEKKNQKTFIRSEPGVSSVFNPVNKSFFASFFSKKEALSSFKVTL